MTKKCAACDSTSTYIMKNGQPHWRHHDGIILCINCYMRYVYRNMNRTAEKSKKYTSKIMPKLMRFKNKRLLLKEKPRKGICEKCGKKKGDKYIDCYGIEKVIKRTSIHHIEYHDDDPLRDTIELCDSMS